MGCEPSPTNRQCLSTVFYRDAQRARPAHTLAGARRAARRARLQNVCSSPPDRWQTHSARTSRPRRARRRIVAARPVGLERPIPRCSKTIANRLGWLDSPALMADSLERLHDVRRRRSRRDGFTDVVLLGMGGSSLAPEVLRAVLGVAPGWPRLHMLDSTDPAAVRAVDDASRARRCISSPASRAPRSSRTRWPRISGSGCEHAGVAALGRSLRRDHR